MEWVRPEILWGLFAVIIPILIHLLQLRRFRTVSFSNVSFLENVKKEIDRKNISADKEIEYMHIEAVNNIKNKITDITLRSVEEVAITEFNNDKSNNIFDEFIKNIPSALTSTK